MKKIINPCRNHEGYLVMGTSGVRSGLIDLFPKDKNRETEVSRDFRFGRGDRYLSHSSHHTQVPVPVTIPVTILPQRHSSPCDEEGREHRGWEKDYHEVTANHIVSAGESHNTQHFSPPFRTFNAKTARNSQIFLYLCSRKGCETASTRSQLWHPL